ncbi:MAG: hypothetical protein A3G49_03805 [Candidatus Sungbacteria bacterium RIFCSPLOWO2_12_FULL_41_11]|uniref:Uncharacterized protein n=1 Tax=Candidatus Sungbacteria bacterium RIFCSPLOWO2_12_FULL_41_11 TaxID=1802286 RepID=A0A1G2LPZ9_9BACT|nr:MAG: hypothetical protein A3G49_03805 [Candidatus Sungbacteria bacterium RIFCSPLOWO2_12_FULL_41_11]
MSGEIVENKMNKPGMRLYFFIRVFLWWLHHPHTKGHAKEDYEKLKKMLAPLHPKSPRPQGEESVENQLLKKPSFLGGDVTGFGRGRERGEIKPEVKPLPISVILSESEESHSLDGVQGQDSSVVPLPEELPQNDIIEIREADPAIISSIHAIEQKSEEEAFLPLPEKFSAVRNRFKSVLFTEKSAPPVSNGVPGFSKLKEKVRFMFAQKSAEVKPSSTGVIPSESESEESQADFSVAELPQNDVSAEPSIREILEVAEELKAPVLPPALSEARLDGRPEPLKPYLSSPPKKMEYPDILFHSLFSWLLRRNGPTHLPAS